jgi:exonuclease III
MQTVSANNKNFWSILNWNIRGVNADYKSPVFRNKLEESGASIVCLQETKRASFDNSSIRKFAPRRFDHFICVPSDGASGGLLVLWNSKLFSGSIRLQESFGVVVDFVSTSDSFSWTLVNVYGPCTEPRADQSLLVGL